MDLLGSSIVNSYPVFINSYKSIWAALCFIQMQATWVINNCPIPVITETSIFKNTAIYFQSWNKSVYPVIASIIILSEYNYTVNIIFQLTAPWSYFNFQKNSRNRFLKRNLYIWKMLILYFSEEVFSWKRIVHFWELARKLMLHTSN